MRFEPSRHELELQVAPVLASDIGVLNALGTRDIRHAKVLAENWRPWRSYAVMRLWQTLEN